MSYSGDFTTYAQFIENSNIDRSQLVERIFLRFGELDYWTNIENQKIISVNKNDHLMTIILSYLLDLNNFELKVHLYTIIILSINFLILFYTGKYLEPNVRTAAIFAGVIFITVPKNLLLLASIYPLSTALLCAISVTLLIYNKFLNADYILPMKYIVFLSIILFSRRIDILTELIVVVFCFCLASIFQNKFNKQFIIYFGFLTSLFVISVSTLNASKTTIQSVVKGKFNYNEIVPKAKKDNISEASVNFIMKLFTQLSGYIDQFHFQKFFWFDRFVSIFIITLMLISIFLILFKLRSTISINFRKGPTNLLIIISLFLYLAISYSNISGSIKVNYLSFIIYLLLFSIISFLNVFEIKQYFPNIVIIFILITFLEIIYVMLFEFSFLNAGATNLFIYIFLVLTIFNLYFSVKKLSI